MPQVGQDYLTGTIVEWLKSENDPVQKEAVVLRVESEKATFDVEADGEGVLLQILHDGGSEVDILSLTLAADHRGVDGVEAAQFLNRLKACLEDVPGDPTLWAV